MTIQRGDSLFYNNKEVTLILGEPFRDYKPKEIKLSFRCTNTANWRGYVCKWKVTDNKLYMLGIRGSASMMNIPQYREGRLALRVKLREGIITPQENGKLLKQLEKSLTKEIDVNMNTIFNINGEDVFASWYTGILGIQNGPLVGYDFSPVYEQLLFLRFKEGNLIGESVKECFEVWDLSCVDLNLL